MDSNRIRETIERVFEAVLTRENPAGSMPILANDLVLLESGLDSLGFAVLVLELEEEFGWDPFSRSSEPFYPITFGELVIFYEAFFASQQQ